MALRWHDQLWPMGGVLSASLLIAWATEVLSFFLSRGLAFALLALLQVAPEFAVEAVITRQAAENPANLQYVTANFTGANRLIVGLFLPMVFFMAASRARRRGETLRSIRLPQESSVEVVALIIPTVYSFSFVLRGNIGLADAALLVAMYVSYLFVAFRLPPSNEEHHDLPLVPRHIRKQQVRNQKWIVAAFFLIGAGLLLGSVEPFYHNTIALGLVIGINAYFLFQWIAPFLSEFPEFVTITYWGKSGRAQLGLTNAISSKVNQWTLLIAMIPSVYVFSTWQLGRTAWTLPFDEAQRLEVLLTAAQGLFAAACLLNLRFDRWEAWTLLGLWAFQLLDPLIDPLLHARFGAWLPHVFTPSTDPVVPHYIREWTTGAYLVLSLWVLVRQPDRFAAIFGFAAMWRRYVRPARA